MSDNITYKKVNIYETDADINQISELGDKYIAFLNRCKTERACVRYFVENAAKNGFKPLDFKSTLKPGDKFYAVNRDKSVYLGIMGNDPENDGIHYCAAHIDSPRLDLKPQPLCEDSGLALLKTHYYGGIKKYQWTALPLQMEGIVITKDGKTIDLSDNDYTFCVTDLLPHLSAEQSSKTVSKAIEGEDLKILCGSVCADTEETDKVKYNVLKILNKRYGITERDLISAEISFVPKLEASSVGFDNSLIGAYGHDDRICAWTAFEALMDAKSSGRTVVVALVDKEETGSDGVTGMQSAFFDMVADKICENCSRHISNYNSKCLSADVNAAFDPIYPSVLDKQNASILGCGPTVTKYTGSRGKSGTSDASAETMAYFVNLFDKNGVVWQSGLLGKVDAGGGGTVAKYIANRNIDTIDIGVGLLSMHAPYEIASKADVYETVRAFRAFMED